MTFHRTSIVNREKHILNLSEGALQIVGKTPDGTDVRVTVFGFREGASKVFLEKEEHLPSNHRSGDMRIVTPTNKWFLSIQDLPLVGEGGDPNNRVALIDYGEEGFNL